MKRRGEFFIKKHIKINFGSGGNIKEGYINVDIHKHPGVNLLCDLNVQPLPFKDNCVDEVLCSHVIEHLINPYLFVLEIHRILKPKGVFHSRLPTNSYSLNHLRSNHTSNYFDVISGTTAEPSLETKPLFIKQSVQGNRRSIKRVVGRLFYFLRSFLYDEYEYKLIKR